MQVTVKLFGTLGEIVQGYVHAEGIVVEIPDNGRVKDLLSTLKLPKSQDVAVVMDGRILARDDQLRNDACINIMQSLHGG